MFVKLFDSLFVDTFKPYVNRWWNICNPIVAYQPKGAVSLAASYTNIVNPGTNDAAPGAAPTWSVTDGWVFNGSSQYLTTGIVPDINTTIIVKLSSITLPAATKAITGASTGASNCYIGCFNSNSVLFRFSDWTATKVANPSNSVLAITQYNGYINGIAVGTNKSPAPITVTDAIIIGGLLDDGNPGAYINPKIQSYAIYDTTLTVSEILTVSQAMEAI